MEEAKKFEDLLREYVPDIYALHVLSKPKEQAGGGENHIWELIKAIIEMNAEVSTGRLEVFFNEGHIDTIKKTTDVLHKKAIRQSY